MLYILLMILMQFNLKSSDWKHVLYAEAGRIVKINYVDSTYSYFNCTKGQRNKIFRSADLGKTWEKISDTDGFEKEPFVINFNNFIQIDTNNWFLSYWYGPIQKTSDGGKTFEKIQVGEEIQVGDGDVEDITMYDSLRGILREEGVKIYITDDGWKTYQLIDRDTTFIYPDLFAPKDSVNYFNISYHTDSDIGRRMHLCVYNTKNNLFKSISRFDFYTDSLVDKEEYIAGFQTINEFLFFAVGSIDNGIGDQSKDLIFRSKDGGRSWEKIIDQEIPSVFGLSRISFYDEMNGIATGNWGKIYMTNNGGETWHIEDPDDMQKVWQGSDKGYGPVNTVIGWLDTVPVLGSFDGNIYRYEGNYFNFNYERIKPCELRYPKNNTMQATETDFSWKLVKDAELYRLQISDDLQFDNIIYNIKTEETEVNIQNLSSNKKYYWRVLTEKGTQIRESEIRTLTTNIEAPINLYPVCNSFDINLSTSLTWSAINNITNYKLEISDDFDFTNLVQNKVISSNTFEVNGLTYGTKYYWRVKALSDGIETDWSDTCNFTTILEPISELLPQCESVDQELDVSLSWSSPKSVLFYDLEYADSEDFIESVKVDSIVKNDYLLEGLKQKTKYYWKVKGFSENANTKWSDICNFETKLVSSVENIMYTIANFSNNKLHFKVIVNDIRIIDILGNYEEIEYRPEIDLSNLERGVYIIQFTFNNQVHNYKYLKD